MTRYWLPVAILAALILATLAWLTQTIKEMP